MAIRAADVMGLIWSHPIFSVVVLLLFTPPLFPVVVFFSPLLISTALVVLAMISMGSNSEETQSYSGDASFKRGWIDEDEDDGPVLDGERASKRLRGVAKDETWFDKVKNWEGTGRAWVESVLNQEARRSDDNSGAKDSAGHLLSAPKALLAEKSPPAVSTTTRQKAPVETAASSDVVPPNVAVNSEFFPNQPRAKLEESDSCGEITASDLTSEDELIEIAPSPLFRRLSLPKSEAMNKTVGEFVESLDSRSKDFEASPIDSNNSEPTSASVESADSEAGGMIPEEVATTDNDVSSVAKQVDGGIQVADENLPNAVVKPVAILSEGASTIIGALQHTKPESTAGELNREPKNVGVMGVVDRSILANAQFNSSGENLPSPPPRPLKSAAEVLGTLRQGKESNHGKTSSVAVALSEKLKVPLEDIMSLYIGEDTDNAPIVEPPVKVVSSSSESTTSQEEEWSSSDEDTSAPPKPAGIPAAE